MRTIATHNAKFHTDDVFAVATLFIKFGKESFKVVRTRDEEIISQADFVVDVGGEYDQTKNKFDHHQVGGAGERVNGAPYASFGLVWKKFGSDICGSNELADIIDQDLVQSIDAGDNGINTFDVINDVFPFTLAGVTDLYRPTWKEEKNWDAKFLEAVDWAVFVIGRLVEIRKADLEAEKEIENVFSKSQDKQIIIFGENHNFGREIVSDVLMNHREPIYAVLYREDANNWQVACIRKERDSFESRKPFPENWRGRRGSELEDITGVHGAVFCHRGGFMCMADSKEGAVALATKALGR